MATPSTQKRQNFNVTAQEEAEIQRLREALGASSVKEALLRATRILLTLTQELGEGKRIYSADRAGQTTRLLLPDIEVAHARWNYLVPRPHSWKRQLYIKGRRTTAANVWLDMKTNERNVAETAENWDLPFEAVEEIVRYCELEKRLIEMEAEEERRFLSEKGIALAPEAGA